MTSGSTGGRGMVPVVMYPPRLLPWLLPGYFYMEAKQQRYRSIPVAEDGQVRPTCKESLSAQVVGIQVY